MLGAVLSGIAVIDPDMADYLEPSIYKMPLGHKWTIDGFCVFVLEIPYGIS